MKLVPWEFLLRSEARACASSGRRIPKLPELPNWLKKHTWKKKFPVFGKYTGWVLYTSFTCVYNWVISTMEMVMEKLRKICGNFWLF